MPEPGRIHFLHLLLFVASQAVDQLQGDGAQIEMFVHRHVLTGIIERAPGERPVEEIRAIEAARHPALRQRPPHARRHRHDATQIEIPLYRRALHPCCQFEQQVLAHQERVAQVAEFHPLLPVKRQVEKVVTPYMLVKSANLKSGFQPFGYRARPPA